MNTDRYTTKPTTVRKKAIQFSIGDVIVSPQGGHHEVTMAFLNHDEGFFVYKTDTGFGKKMSIAEAAQRSYQVVAR